MLKRENLFSDTNVRKKRPHIELFSLKCPDFYYVPQYETNSQHFDYSYAASYPHEIVLFLIKNDQKRITKW